MYSDIATYVQIDQWTNGQMDPFVVAKRRQIIIYYNLYQIVCSPRVALREFLAGGASSLASDARLSHLVQMPERSEVLFSFSCTQKHYLHKEILTAQIPTIFPAV